MKSFKIENSEYLRQLMTKQEIIDIWLSCCGNKLNEPCCPTCRDTLTVEDNIMFCENHMCLNEEIYEVQA
jgi:hypothetical protein